MTIPGGLLSPSSRRRAPALSLEETLQQRQQAATSGLLDSPAVSPQSLTARPDVTAVGPDGAEGDRSPLGLLGGAVGAVGRAGSQVGRIGADLAGKAGQAFREDPFGATANAGRFLAEEFAGPISVGDIRAIKEQADKGNFGGAAGLTALSALPLIRPVGKAAIDAIEAVGKKIPENQLDELVDLAKKGGFTFNPRSKKLVDEGIVVGAFPNRTRAIPLSEFKPADLNDFVRDNRDVLQAGENIHLGAWVDEKTNNLVLDLSLQLPESQIDEAARLGRIANQEGVFNIGAFRRGEEGFIPTGGTGEPLTGTFLPEELTPDLPVFPPTPFQGLLRANEP